MSGYQSLFSKPSGVAQEGGVLTAGSRGSGSQVWLPLLHASTVVRRDRGFLGLASCKPTSNSVRNLKKAESDSAGHLMAPLASTGGFGVGIPKCVMHCGGRGRRTRISRLFSTTYEFMDTLC